MNCRFCNDPLFNHICTMCSPGKVRYMYVNGAIQLDRLNIFIDDIVPGYYYLPGSFSFHINGKNLSLIEYQYDKHYQLIDNIIVTLNHIPPDFSPSTVILWKNKLLKLKAFS